MMRISQGVSINSTIDKAIKESRVCIMQYLDAKGKPSVREVECYEIKNGKLYAWCLVKNGTRAFNMNNIGSLTLKEDTFVPRF